MAEDDDKKNPLADLSFIQNPAPFPETGQEAITLVRRQTDKIMAQFLKVLASNYQSEVPGPFYTLQFQAAAEQLALLQLTAQEVFKDSQYDYTRPEFLWEVLGAFVFPGAQNGEGRPHIDGVAAYRDFLKRMVLLLLRGARASTVQEGTGLLTDAEVLLIERFIGARDPNSEWSLEDQFAFDLNIEREGGSAFPEDPFVLQENVELVLQALKPAHTLHSYRHLFEDVFGDLFEDESSWELDAYYYDDFRHHCYGAREITGTTGVTAPGRTGFYDASRSFHTVRPGALLRVTSGPNAGAYRVRQVFTFPVANDATPRPYTTSPTGLSGMVVVTGDYVMDAAQDFSLATEGEVLTVLTGPNAGTYRLDTLLGAGGGPVGFAPGPSTRVRVSPSYLRLDRKMPEETTGQTYSVDVDRLGVRLPKVVFDEDVSDQFYL